MNYFRMIVVTLFSIVLCQKACAYEVEQDDLGLLPQQMNEDVNNGIVSEGEEPNDSVKKSRKTDAGQVLLAKIVCSLKTGELKTSKFQLLLDDGKIVSLQFGKASIEDKPKLFNFIDRKVKITISGRLNKNETSFIVKSIEKIEKAVLPKTVKSEADQIILFGKLIAMQGVESKYMVISHSGLAVEVTFSKANYNFKKKFKKFVNKSVKIVGRGRMNNSKSRVTFNKVGNLTEQVL